MRQEVGRSMAFTNSSTSPSSSFLTPLPPAPPKASQAVLPVQAGNHPYFDLLYHPFRWDWIRGQWLPTLRRLSHSEGCQNVDKDGSTALAHAIEGAQGWVRIPHDLPCGDYLARYPAIGGDAHFFRWEQQKLLAGRLLTSSDEEGYVEWLSQVCEYLRLAPDPDVMEVKVQLLVKVNGEDSARARLDPRAADRFQETAKQIEAMRAAMHGDAPVVEPVVEATHSPRRKS